MKKIIYLTIFVCCSVTVISFSTGPQSAVQWIQWEYSLKSDKNSEKQPLNVDVVFKGPGGKSLRTRAFSDDGVTYRFRAAFPSSGLWKWKTFCSDKKDKALHNKKGKVIVESYTGDNPLYKHGDLRVSDNKRYLVHADGTPFLWIGETGWRATQNTTIGEWHDYVDTRKAQKFTVIQISPRGVSKKPVTELEDVSFKEDGAADPLFWEDLETKITYANQKGLIIFMVGIGKSWRDHFTKNPINQDFESYITGRLAGLMVIYSPSFDQLFDTGNDAVAVELNNLTTHLVTQHPGTNYEANVQYRNAVSVDFCGMQSGHHGGRLEQAYNAARQWTLDMWNGDPVKPVIDIEAMYDAYGNNNAKNWREKDARKLGWIAWLSGSKGYTYGAGDVPPKVPAGAGGVWRFNKDSAAYDFWRKAILWPSAVQMTIMHDFFAKIDWWLMVPCHDIILNQAGNDTLKMVASKSEAGDFLLAYLPDNSSVELDLSSLPTLRTVRWFNPETGRYDIGNQSVNPGKRVYFTRPEGWEDALLFLTK